MCQQGGRSLVVEKLMVVQAAELVRIPLFPAHLCEKSRDLGRALVGLRAKELLTDLGENNSGGPCKGVKDLR